MTSTWEACKDFPSNEVRWKLKFWLLVYNCLIYLSLNVAIHALMIIIIHRVLSFMIVYDYRNLKLGTSIKFIYTWCKNCQDGVIQNAFDIYNWRITLRLQMYVCLFVCLFTCASTLVWRAIRNLLLVAVIFWTRSVCWTCPYVTRFWRGKKIKIWNHEIKIR